MGITLTPLDGRGADRADLVDFLTAHEYPFHVTSRPDRTVVERWIDEGRYDPADHAPYWIGVARRRIGVVVLDDLSDDAPMFDMRLGTEYRGRGLGAVVLKALTAHVFTTMHRVNRFEGQTREDNIAMRRTFLRAGFVKEAHYRESWPVDGGSALDSVAYGILRRDWQTGATTPVAWDDLRR